MKKNVRTPDRIIRFLIAAAMIILYVSNVITGIIGILLLVFAAIFIVTALVGFCPLYLIFGRNARAGNQKVSQ